MFERVTKRVPDDTLLQQVCNGLQFLLTFLLIIFPLRGLQLIPFRVADHKQRPASEHSTGNTPNQIWLSVDCHLGWTGSV